MSNKPCKVIIKNKYNDLTKIEKKIADYLLSNDISFMQLPISKFAENVGVAGSAVIRFCKTLGFSGYSDFKMNMAMEAVKEKSIAILPDIGPEDNIQDIVNTVFSSSIKALKDTLKMLDLQKIPAIIEKLSCARHIYLYAVGTSIPLIEDMQKRLMRLGYISFSISDVYEMQMSLMNITPQDFVIAISHSGRTEQVVNIVKKAKELYVPTLCITSYSESTLAKLCDFSLVDYSDENKYPIEAVSSRIAHMAIIDAIIVALTTKNFEDAKLRTERTVELLGEIRYEK